MARRRAAYRKLQLQRRYAVDQVRLREMSREARDRAAVIRPNPLSKKTIEQINLERYAYDLLDLSLQDLTPSELNSKRRKLQWFLGLEDLNLKTPRDVVLSRLNRMHDHAELVFSVGSKALFLIRREDKLYYFLYREKGSYYKKSVPYDSRIKAMDRYERECISWIEFFSE